MVKFGVHMGTNQPFLKFKVPDIVKSSQLADTLGFDSIWVMDHLNWTPISAKTVIPDAFILLGHLADKVKNATLGTCVTDPHRRHPAQIALAALTMQDLTKGRFILGIGAGEAANLIDFGVPCNKPVTRLKEATKVIKLLWNSTVKKSVSFQGEFFHLDHAGLQFKVAAPPKLYLAANSPKTIQFTGEIADGWIPANITADLYKKQLKILEKGGRASEIDKCIEIWIAISKENPEMAKRAIKAPASVLIARKEILSPHNIEIPEDIELESLYREPIRFHTKKQQQIIEFVSKNVPDEIIESIAIAGSPDEVIDQINEFIKAGAEHFIFEFIGDYFNSLKLFAEEVMPHFKSE
ncbi:MAG: LLM class flavin-dependent oxidoreductase [Candidatus Helarchaeota archaeon]